MTTDPMSGEGRATLLRGSYVFNGLDAEVLGRVAQLAVVRQLEPAEPLFWQGDDGDALYGVVSGLVRIWLTGPDGKELTLSLMEPGDFFGEIALLDGGPRTATVTAETDLVVEVIAQADFHSLLTNAPTVTRRILSNVGSRLRATNVQLAAQSA
jgi:CRP-like cAMP-binding protein